MDLSFIEGFVNACDRSFDFENILRGFDQQKIHAALNQTDSLLAEGIHEFVEADIGKFGVVGGGKLAGGSYRTCDKTRLTCFLGIFICKPACKFCSGFVDLDDAVT